MSVVNLISFGFFLAFFILLWFPLVFSVSITPYMGSAVCTDYFLFDGLSLYLCVLVVFLGLYGIFSFSGQLDGQTLLFLSLSLLFTCLCFCTNHAVLFWCFYELSMLPLLYLIFRDSPYSERFIAGWYFSVYLLVTSLPLILILLYASNLNASLYFSSWEFASAPYWLCALLAFIFFTKVPLCPFHTWLPIVHAEATSIVSIFLSGYIMKLGLLGVYRCVPFIFSGPMLIYLFICLTASVMFIVTACAELDGKRWLALLSLSHILVPFVAFFVCGWDNMSLSFLYCLGHGLGAGILFGLLWYFYESVNSRNWLLMKTGVTGGVLTVVLCLCMLSLCSFPPTIQFFCEVKLLSASVLGWAYILFWGFYLFLGGLVPLVLCGHLLIRSEGRQGYSWNTHSFMFYLFYLLFWCYLGVFLL
uniref:NADH-ubiquinone oxidoreductase chain 4 n=1 Tax=Haplobothrium globuliforme TaxID=108250 RepID=A0A8F7GLI2_9CEST|nr:NADH dehydrogenase subunit 4 [Haplobothrium globuliforme]